MYLKELLKVLQYRDLRSVRKWCINNQVRVLFDTGSKWRFVLREELEKALNKIQQTPLENTPRRKKENHGKYTPQGEIEKSFLSTLQI